MLQNIFHLLLSADPHSKNFKYLLIASEIGVTLIVFVGFYFVFNSFNKKMKKHKEVNPEILSRSSEKKSDQNL
jgi:phosphotransferase system  glucose/maltose/N-acetylglucosamine-specific IIC component